MIVVTTLEGEFRYRVVSTRVVSPETVAVLNASTLPTETGGMLLGTTAQ